MKRWMENLTPWAVARWGFAVLLYAGTVAIAVDQVGMKKQEAEAAKSKLHQEVKSATIERRNLVAQERAKAQAVAKKANEGLEYEVDRLKRELAQADLRISAAESKAERAYTMGKTSAVLESLTAPSPSVSSRPYSVAGVTGAVPSVAKTEIIPSFTLPPAAKAAAFIKSQANQKWGTDYSMVQYEIDKQTKAFAALSEYYKQRWKPIIREIIDSSAQKWGTDYGMVVYEIEKQMKAKQIIDQK